MRYTHTVSGIDSTLINTTGAVLHGLRRALRDITGEHWDINRLLPVLGIPGLDAPECLGIHSPDQIFRIYPRWEQHEQEYQYTAYLYEGIVPLLDFLKKKGRNSDIITSKTMPQYTCSFLPLQISGYFQTIITADDTIRHKLDPEPMSEYMEHTDACSRQILYIGDSIYDMQCAPRAGVDSRLALWGCHCPDGTSSTHRSEDPAAIIRWLERYARMMR